MAIEFFIGCNIIDLFISNTHTKDLLIYVTATINNMTPYSCFRAEISIDKVNRNTSEIDIERLKSNAA